MPDVETSSIQINITAEDNASTTLASITKKLETFATALTQVQASWNSFTENQTAIKTLESVANSINAINGKKIDIKFTGDAIDGKTAENMKKTQEAMEEAAKPASKVAESAEEIRESAQKAADSTQGMTKDWDKLSDSVENASEQASQGYDKIAKSAEKARTQQEKAAESTRNLGNALGISFSHITKTVSLLAVFDAETKVISHQLGLLKGTLSATASGFKALAKASAELIKVTGKISIAIGKAFGRIAVAPIQLMANTIGKVVTKLKDMFAGLVRIATYRLFRSMIKWITQGLSEGIANLYQWSKALDQAFSKAMDLYATDRQYLNNSFAAMLEPLIEQVIPILDQAVDKMVDLLNQFNQFFSAVTGKSTWTKALKVATEYDDVAKDAKKSTDELKRSLLGFDEINRLDDPDKNKKNKKEVDYSAMFKEMPIESDIGNLARKLKELIKADQWFEAGQLLAQKLNELLDMWEPEQAGKIIAKKINNAVDIARGFITTANWKKLGVKFAGTINNLLYNINAKNIGKLIADTLNSAFKFGLGFLETIDGAAIGKNLSDIFNGFFEELDTATIGKTISELLSKAFDIGISYFKNLDKDAFYNSILTLIENIKFGELGDKFADLFNAISGVLDADKISKIFGGLIQGIATFLINAVNNMEIGEMVTNITTTLANLLSDEKTITKVAQAAEALIKGAFTAIGTFISTFPVNDLFNAITTFFNNIHWNEIGDQVGTYLQTAINNIDPTAIGNAIVAVFESALDLLGNITDKLSEYTTITLDVQEDGTLIQQQMTYWEAFGYKIGDAISNALNGIDWEKAGETLSKLGVGITSMIRMAIETADKDGKLSESIDTLINTIDWETIATNLMIIIADQESAIFKALKALGKAMWQVLKDAFLEGFKEFFSSLASLNVSDLVSGKAKAPDNQDWMPSGGIGGLPNTTPATRTPTNAVSTDEAIQYTEDIRNNSAVQQQMAQANYGYLNAPEQTINVTATVDGDVLFNSVVKTNNQTVKQTGQSPLYQGR